MHLAESPVKSVLTVSGNVAMNLCLVNVGTFETLWDVLAIASIVEWVHFLLLTPPVRIDHRVDAS